MSLLTVHHTTTYTYSAPVFPGEHRMMFRPREGHDLRVLRSALTITPQPVDLRWQHDPFDNAVAVARFSGATTELRFDSSVTIQHFEAELFDYPIEDAARSYPFQYSENELEALAQGLSPHYPDQGARAYALQFLEAAPSSDTMNLLLAMNQRIRDEFSYTQRYERGVQSPDETLSLRSGSCRDFAVLMMECVRTLGIAARFVSGYIYVPDLEGGNVGGGATHAWMQAFLPGAGWIDFDPTNSIAGTRDLIRVGVAWKPEQVVPLSGSFTGPGGASQGMNVSVTVTRG